MILSSLQTEHVHGGIPQSVLRRAAGWTAEESGFDSQHEQDILIFSTASRSAVVPIKLPIQWIPGAVASGVKTSEREADHSPSSSAEVKNSFGYTD
jgi:hypothetical protein